MENEKKKKPLADRLAEFVWSWERTQEIWKEYQMIFGPILEPAFAEDVRGRLEIMAVLTRIRRGQLKAALKKMQRLKDRAVTDADKVMWMFCGALCFEAEGKEPDMMRFLITVNAMGHDFYLPYLKVAYVAHKKDEFEDAEENYRKAIEKLGGGLWNSDKQPIAATMYGNLASCLTMMHHYQEAEEAMRLSRRIHADQPGREATEAILYAATGRTEEMEASLASLQKTMPTIEPKTRKMVEKICAGEHSHFAAQPMDEAQIAAFWQEVLQEEPVLRRMVAEKREREVLQWLDERLIRILPETEHPLRYRVLENATTCMIELSDYYAVGIRFGYEKILAARPATLDAFWQFRIVH